MANWGFDTTAKRYRNLGNGRFLAKSKVVALRDAVVEAAGREARSLAEQVVRGTISPEAFREGMRIALRNSYAAETIFGRGGVNAMTSADFGRLGSDLRTAFSRIEPLVAAAAAGTVSEAQAANRAQMAVDGGCRAFEQGQAAAWGIAASLPEYPGDRCEGMTRCRCSWSVEETDDAIEATWTLGGSDPCGPCQGNADRYNPHAIPKHAAVPDTAPIRLALIDHGLRLAG